MFRRVKLYHQWLRSSIHLKTKFSQSPSDSVRLQGPSKRTSSDLLYPVSSIKERNRKGGKCEISRVLQSPVSCTQASPKVEASNRPKQAQHLPTCRKVQNGKGHLHRLQGCILPYTNSQSVQEVHAFPHPGSVLPVQCPTLWSVHSTHGVHSGGQRVQTDGFTEGYKNPPVPRGLVGESHVPPNLSPAYTDFGSSLSRTRLVDEQGKVRTGPKTGFQLRRLPVRPQEGQGQTHTRALANLNRQDIVNPVRSGVPGLAVHVPHRTSNSHRKAGPLRATSYETHTVALEKQLEGTRITGKGNTSPQVALPPLKVVAGGKECAFRSTITPTKTCSADIYRCIKIRVGCSLKRTHCKGNLVHSRKQVAHKSLGTKDGLSGPKRVPRPLFKHSPGSHRQHNSGCLYQQRGGDEMRLPFHSRKQVAHTSLGTKGGLSGPKRVPRPLFKHSPGSHRQHNSGCLYQ